MKSTSLSETDLPVVWVKRPDNLPLSTGASVEPISMAVSATLASLTIIIFIFLTIRLKRQRAETLHYESEEVKPTNDIQAAVKDAAPSQSIEARASEDEPDLQASFFLNDTYASSEARTSDSLAELKLRYERQLAEVEQITFRMSGQTTNYPSKNNASPTEGALSVSNYSRSEMCTVEKDHLGAPDE